MILPGVYTQRTPAAGDLDECWVYATIWAAKAADSQARIPGVTEFRREAGDPDDGIRDGGSIAEVEKASRAIWPHITQIRYQRNGSAAWDGLMVHLRAGRTVSLSVDSGDLPSYARFGFTGKHAVGVALRDGNLYLANPLAAQGSRPLVISEASLERAALGLLPGTGYVYAYIFVPVHHYRVSVRAGTFWFRYIRKADGTFTRERRFTLRGFSADCEQAGHLLAMGSRRSLCRLTSGVYAGSYVDTGSYGVNYREV